MRPNVNKKTSIKIYQSSNLIGRMDLYFGSIYVDGLRLIR